MAGCEKETYGRLEGMLLNRLNDLAHDSDSGMPGRDGGVLRAVSASLHTNMDPEMTHTSRRPHDDLRQRLSVPGYTRLRNGSKKDRP